MTLTHSSSPGRVRINIYEVKNRTENFTQSLLHRKKPMSLLCLSALSRNRRYITDYLVPHAASQQKSNMYKAKVIKLKKPRKRNMGISTAIEFCCADRCIF